MRGLTAARWRVPRPVLERVRPRDGRGFADFDRSFAGVVFRSRTGVPWRDLPPRFGAWQRAWALHRRRSRLGVRDAPLAQSRAAGRPDLAEVFVDGTVARPPEGRRAKGGSEALGRSRGGLTTKAVAAVDCSGGFTAARRPGSAR